MRYKLLGASGLRVSEFALGTMTFGENWGWGAPKHVAAEIYDWFREAGGNFIDTADFYTRGTSECFLRDFINKDRNGIVLGTKYAYSDSDCGPNGSGTHRKNLVRSVEASLKRLDTDYIDILWVNGWDFLTPEREVMRALDDLVKAGKINYIGIADAPAWIIARCNTLAETHSWTSFIGLQIQYNLTERTAERELFPMAKTMDVGILACSPLAGGLLSGKYFANPNVEGRLGASLATSFDSRERGIYKTISSVAKETGYNAAQVAIAWVRDHGVIPIIGARTVDQVKNNLGTLELSLSAEQRRQLDAISAIELGFPHDFLVKTRCVTSGGMFDRIDRHRERGIGITGR